MIDRRTSGGWQPMQVDGIFSGLLTEAENSQRIDAVWKKGEKLLDKYGLFIDQDTKQAKETPSMELGDPEGISGAFCLLGDYTETGDLDAILFRAGINIPGRDMSIMDTRFCIEKSMEKTGRLVITTGELGEGERMIQLLETHLTENPQAKFAI